MLTLLLNPRMALRTFEQKAENVFVQGYSGAGEAKQGRALLGQSRHGRQ